MLEKQDREIKSHFAALVTVLMRANVSINTSRLQRIGITQIQILADRFIVQLQKDLTFCFH